MSSDIILSIENVSKLYRLGTVGTGTFGGDVQRFWKTKILGQEDPFMKVGQINDRTSKDKAEFVWALQDINFEVKRGEVLGIIGKNGAGKSTLLKLLSRITTPTKGTIKSAGRMASLLEVGTGFHPELTGRENIFLNGAILGMTKKEIKSKFDEIVDFSGCELYIDTPTKRYSSGMTVRLGFAIASFLDPEILIVDEVLAVGDAEFQKKAIGKMKDISEDGGRTVLFVSHNLNSIRELCTSAILLSNGKITTINTVSNVLNSYLNETDKSLIKRFNNTDTLPIDILSAELGDIHTNEEVLEKEIVIKIEYKLDVDLKGSVISLTFRDNNQSILMSFDTDINSQYIDFREKGKYQSIIIIPPFTFKPGNYSVSLAIGIAGINSFCRHDDILKFLVVSTSNKYSLKSYREDRNGVVPLILNWDTRKV